MKNNHLPHLAGRVFGVPLLIQPQKLSVILQVIGPRLGSRPDFTLEGEIVPAMARMPMDNDPQEMDDEARGQKPYEVTPEGVAVIGISGTLVKKASWLDAESGLQSYQSIRSQLMDARNDPRIRGVLLDVDSPGGEVGGLFDLADEVFAMRQEKPCFAIANDEAYSAAYALASSAERLFVTRTGGVGSIGVIALHVDQSAFDEKMGRKYTAIYAGAKKNDFSPHEPLSQEARTELQGEIDRLYDIFVQTVGRNRDLKPALVRSTEAGLFFADKAVAAGLADRVGTFDDAVAAVVAAAAGRKQARVAASAEAQIPEQEMEMIDPTKKADAEPAPAEQKQPEQPAQPAEQKPPEQPVQQPEQPAQQDPAATTAALEARLRGEFAESAAACLLAGEPGFLAEAIAKRMSPAQVREALLARKAAEQQRTALQSHTQAAPVGAESQLTAAATNLAASKGITFAQGYVEALKANPILYQQYLAEKSATVKPN